MTDDTDLTPEYIDSVCRAAPFADNDAGIPQMVALIRALSARLAEVEAERNQYAEGYAQTLGRKWNADDAMIRAAAAEAALKMHQDLDAISVDEVNSLTAQLAQAVEALREISGECGCSTARAVIAQIGGGAAKPYTIPSPDALIRAALEVAAEFLQSHEGYDAFPEVHPLVASIRALADNPATLAAIKAKAAEGRE
jgi:hypothetical protein